MKSIAIIPARSGSKGLQNKNIRLLNGKPLLAYSIEAALQSGVFDTVHLSTDSESYAEIGLKYGADIPFLRYRQTAADQSSSWSVVEEVLNKYERRQRQFESVMLLQPTSPLRLPEDICAAYHVMEARKAKAVVSVCETDHSPLWCAPLPESGCMDGFIPKGLANQRQALKKYYRINGSIYLLLTEHFNGAKTLIYDKSCFAYVMPKSRSVDIDDEYDFLIAEAFLKQFCQSAVGVRNQ